MGGSTGGGQPTRLPNVGPTASKVTGLISGLPGQNYGTGVAPSLQKIGLAQSAATQGPMGAAAQQGAQTGANIGTGIASGVGGLAQSMIPNATNIMNMGFDPQQALYNRTLQQVQDQARVAQAQRGIATSPYGAGLEDQATRQFNIDWQNQQLNRATQAAQAAQGLGSSAFNLGSGASNLAQTAAGMPLAEQMALLNQRAQAITGTAQNITAASAPRQQAISDFLGYLGMGPGYQSSAAQQQGVSQAPLQTAMGILPALFKAGG